MPKINLEGNEIELVEEIILISIHIIIGHTNFKLILIIHILVIIIIIFLRFCLSSLLSLFAGDCGGGYPSPCSSYI